MRQAAVLLAAMAAALVLASGVALTQTAPGTGSERAPHPGPVPGEYIVVLDEQHLGRSGGRLAEVAERDEAEHPGLEVQRVYGAALEGYAAKIPEGEVADVEDDPGVLFVAPNRRYELAATPQEPAFPSLLVNAEIDRVEADKSSTRSGDGRGAVNVDVAVIDDGIDVQHRELNVAGGKNCASGEGYDQDAGDFGHGTAVAGLIGSRDHTRRSRFNDTVGVAPGARLWALDVFDGFVATDASVICAVEWVTARSGRIEVANMSLGGRGTDDGRCGVKSREALHYAVCRSVKKGVTYVTSAGNFGVNFKRETPAAYDEVITVTAVDSFGWQPNRRRDEAADFSNYTTSGSPDARHTIAAPGSFLHIARPGNEYGFGMGTSYSAPLVAGAAALYKSQHPNASPRRVLEELRAEARQQPRSYGFKGDPHRPIRNRYYGHMLYVGDF